MLGKVETNEQLSIHALSGTYNHQTIRVWGSKGTRTIFLLIGFRSSHNFLEKMVTKQLGCIKESICALNVAVANGNQLMFDEITMGNARISVSGWFFHFATGQLWHDSGNSMVGRVRWYILEF